uniref:SufE family protein n=1 Tax=Salmonella enterica TaxID=28901 RepID=UPI0032973D8D
MRPSNGGFLGSDAAVVVNAAAAYLAPMSTAAPERSIDATLADLVEEFDLLGDWEGRIEYVIELGKELEPLAEADRIDANKVPGCA